MASKVEILRRCVWIVDALALGRRLTFTDLYEGWKDGDRWRKPFSERTLKRDIEKIRELFGIEIVWIRSNVNRYYIKDADSKQSKLISRLFAELSLVNMAMDNSVIEERIIFSHPLSGYEFLSEIVNGLTTRRALKITYASMGSGEVSELTVCPHSLHQFGKRWYLLATLEGHKKRGVYALDRIRDCRLTDEMFQYDSTLDPKKYFDEVVGVNLDDEYDCVEVVFRVYDSQRKYVEEIPLHKTQELISEQDDYSDYRVKVRPEYEFIHEILKLGRKAEVLSPEWVREEVRWEAEQILQRYDPK